MPSIKRYIFLFIFNIFYLLSFSQFKYIKYNLEEFNVENGLSQSQIVALYQDSRGYLWIGTNGGGITIYNGKEFKTLSTDEGMSDNVVYSIIEDKTGKIWIGTNNGLSVYNGYTFKNYSINDGLPHERIYKIIQDKVGIIWIGTQKGLVKYQNNKFTLISDCSALTDIAVFSLFIDHQNNLWAGTFGKGVVKYNINTNSYTIYNSENGLCHNNVRTIIQDPNGNIWIGTLQGLNVITNNELRKVNTSYKLPTITSSLISKDGEVWFGTYFRTLLSFKSDNTFTEHLCVPTGVPVWTILEDKEGTIWIGTINGLKKFSQRCFYSYGEKDSLINNNIISLAYTPNGEIWAGHPSDGATKITFSVDNKPHFTNYVPYVKFQKQNPNTIIGSKVNAIYFDNNNSLWFGTYNGISIYNINTKKFINYTTNEAQNDNKAIIANNLTSPNIYSFCKDHLGTMWIGTTNGVTQYYNNEFVNFNTLTPETKILDKKAIYHIFEDKYNYIWFSTDNSVYIYDRNTIFHLGKEEGLTEGIVVSVIQDASKNYWLASKEGLLWIEASSLKNYINKESNSVNSACINKNSGLASNNIYLLILDNNQNLFIGTDKGIDKLNTRIYNRLKKINITHFGSKEGFYGQECNQNACCIDNEGKLWFGTIKGITVYDPKYDLINTYKPITYITKIKLEFQDFDYSKFAQCIDSTTRLPVNLTFPYNKNHLTFEFIATSLVIPSKVMYQFMMEGIDKDWSPPSTENRATYSSLPPGEFIYKVRACNNDGIWNETPTTFGVIIIKPPFWRTWWFYTIIAIIAIISIYFYIRMREARLRRDKLRLERKVRQRTLELVKQKELVEEKNRDIMASITYAKRIQFAMLPPQRLIKQYLPESFIFYRPRDIVSGDFYWLNISNNKILFAAADCTGHGVPGALISMVGNNTLNQAVIEHNYSKPSDILNFLNQGVNETLRKTAEGSDVKDGMDIALISIDFKNKMLEYAGANNSIYIVSNGELTEYKADKQPIGAKDDTYTKPFTNNEINFEFNDVVYLTSDGYADQFGGPQGKKFMSKNMKRLMVDIYNKPINEQYSIIEQAHDQWRGNTYAQVDDVLVVGIKLINN